MTTTSPDSTTVMACTLTARLRDGSHQAAALSHTPTAGLNRLAGPFVGARELEHVILHLLAEEAGPLGSGTLLERLQELDYGGSEPTIGRFLRTLDRRGLTTRMSNRGRMLTDAGHRRLHQHCEAEAQRFYERELIRTIRPTTTDDLLDVLVARRALEREIARLAAEHATAEDVACLEEAIQAQRVALTTIGVAIDADITFHALLAQAAGNRVLAAAIDLIRRDRQATLQLDAILKYTDHKWVVGHERILRAVKRGAPAAAERAMLEHIDALIADVRSYRDRVVADVAVPAAPTSDGLPNRPETVDG
jgi:GntR family L-lactate dehydrogenase operon transcriptional regulator